MEENHFDVVKRAAFGQSAARRPQHLIERNLILNRLSHVDDLLHRRVALVRRAAVVNWKTSAVKYFF
jgi:hypothetical protein